MPGQTWSSDPPRGCCLRPIWCTLSHAAKVFGVWWKAAQSRATSAIHGASIPVRNRGEGHISRPGCGPRKMNSQTVHFRCTLWIADGGTAEVKISLGLAAVGGGYRHPCMDPETKATALSLARNQQWNDGLERPGRSSAPVSSAKEVEILFLRSKKSEHQRRSYEKRSTFREGRPDALPKGEVNEYDQWKYLKKFATN
jgi:hypothetical protein